MKHRIPFTLVLLFSTFIFPWPSVYAQSTPQTEIGYIRQNIPPFEIPSYEGERYDDLIPDTLDVAEMAKLAIHGLTGPTDPESDYELYFLVNFVRNPPVMIHDFGDGNQAKYMSPLVLNRLISGSDLNLHIERTLMEAYLKSIGPDGLYYKPMQGKPWTHAGSWDVLDAPDETADLPRHGGPTPLPHRLMETFLLYYLRDGNPVWKDIVLRNIEYRSKIMVNRGDWGYFGSPNEIPTGFLANNGWIIQSLTSLALRVSQLEPGELLSRSTTSSTAIQVVSSSGFFPRQKGS